MTLRGSLPEHNQAAKGRLPEQNHASHQPLAGWKLVVVIAEIAIVIIATLLFTESPASVAITTAPLLVAIGAITIRRS